MRRDLVIPFLLIGLCLLNSLSWAAPVALSQERQPTVGIGVSPMIIDYTFPSRHMNTATTIEIESAVPIPYRVEPVATDLIQDEDGTLLPATAGAHPASCAPWLTFDQATMNLEPRGKLAFPVAITRPPRMTGTHLCGIRFVATPAMPPSAHQRDKNATHPGAAQMTFTYTVVFKLTLPGSSPTPKLAFDRAHLIGEPPYPTVDVIVHNISDTGFPLSMTAELRQHDGSGNVRVPLLIQRGHDKVATQTLWPDGTARAMGRVPLPIPPGRYTLTVRAVAQRRVIQHVTEVMVPSSESAELAWQDPIKPLILKPKQRLATTFYLYNLTNSTVLPTVSVAPAHPALCQGWTIDVTPSDGPIGPRGYRRLQGIFTAGPSDPSTCAVTVTAKTGAIHLSSEIIASTPLGTTPPAVTLKAATYQPASHTLSLTLENDDLLPAVFSSWTAFVTSGPRHVPIGHWSHDDPRPIVPEIPMHWTIPHHIPLAPGVYSVRLLGFWRERTVILGEQELLVSGEDSTHTQTGLPR